MHAFTLLLWCGLLVTSAVGGNNETKWLALLEFKTKITDNPLQVMSSWNDSIRFCQWRGVTCGPRHQRVTVLNFPSSKLVGSLSPHVGNLSFLKNLTLKQQFNFIMQFLQKLTYYANCKSYICTITHLVAKFQEIYPNARTSNALISVATFWIGKSLQLLALCQNSNSFLLKKII